MTDGIGWSDALTSLHEDEAGSNLSIDIHSRHCVVATVRRYAPNPSSILELGSSSGYLLSELSTNFPDADIVGSDVVPSIVEKLKNTQTQKIELIDINTGSISGSGDRAQRIRAHC